MELNRLRGFLMVARTGSFTRAAEALFLTQPALSLQVKALETSLGERLFERQGRRLLLTPAGRILQRQAEQILDLVEQTGEEITALQGVARGQLTVGTNDSYCLYLLPALVQIYRERFPGIELHLTNSNSSEVAVRVADGAVDFGFVTLPVSHARLLSTPLLWREDVLICAPRHPLCQLSAVTLDQVVGYPMLLLDRGSSRTLLDTLFAESGQSPRVTIELGSVEVIKRYVETDLGISIVPRFAVEREVAGDRLHATRLEWLPHRAVGLVQRDTGYLSPAAREFIRLLKDYAASHWEDCAGGT